jgi:hypothetical protein
MLRCAIKLCHELGAIGLAGSVAACLALLAGAAGNSSQDIAIIVRWVLMPSLAVVCISGLLAIAANAAYLDAGWAWVKALLGLSLFECALLLSGATASGELRTQRGTLWLLLAMSVANVGLGIWRPRFAQRDDA